MRLGRLTATMLSLVLVGTSTQAQSPVDQWSSKHFFGPAAFYSVSITSANEVLTTFEVPSGVFLSVYANDVEVAADRSEFRGDTMIRMRLRTDVPSGVTPGEDIMSEAPLVMLLENVTVVVERVAR
jgi:hypothetical protein